MKRFQIIVATCAALLLAIFAAVVIYRLVVPGSELVLNVPLGAAQVASDPTPTPMPVECPEEAVAQYLSDLDRLIVQWDDGVRLAGATSRIALSPVVNTLQTLRRDAASLTPPACAQYLHEVQALFMDYIVEGLLAFMEHEEQSVLEENFHAARVARNIFNSHLAAIRNDPLAAHIAAHEPITITGPFELTDTWQNVRMVKDEPEIFSMPQDWQLRPADAYDKILLIDPTGEIRLHILTNRVPDFMTATAPPAAMAQVQASLGFNGDPQVAQYGTFGENIGYIVNSFGPDGHQIGGAVLTPDGAIYWFDATQKNGLISDEAEQIIHEIIASIRLAM